MSYSTRVIYFLKQGYSPISVFVITIIMTLFAEIVACFVLKRYLDYSVKDYLIQVYGRCLLVSFYRFLFLLLFI